MRIAMFSDNFYPELSGISDSLIESAKELAGVGHEIDFYAARYSAKDFKTYNVPFEELDLGPNVRFFRMASFRYPAPTQQARMVVPTLLRWLSMRKNRPDIIHVHHIFGVGIEGLAASKFLDVPLVGTSHTPITEFLHYGPFQGKFLDKFGLKYVSWFYNRCQYVTAPSQGILDEMKANGFKQPSRPISNPIDLRNFYPVSKEEKQKIKNDFGLSGFTVLYTGRLASEKHIDVIIRAINLIKDKIPNISFAITGHGDAKADLEKLVEGLGLGGRVRFFGTLSMEDHAKIYKAADVFAIASTAETQSLSLMKAMATGLPSIGVNARALPEYINKDNGFIVEPGDYEGMAEKIMYLFENPEAGEKLGRGGIELVKEFSPAKIGAEWNNLYKEVTLAHKSGKIKAYET